MRGWKAVGISAGIGLAAAWPAYAHTAGAAGAGFGAGFAHPFLGLDHLLALLAAGIWAGHQTGSVRLAVPAVFAAVMALAALVAVAGPAIPGIEAGIAASVLVLGLLVAARARLPLPAGLALVAVFAFLHGHAHGTEMPHAASVARYALGMLLATVLLQSAGFLLGERLRHFADGIGVRVGGAAIAAGGALGWVAG